MLLVASFQFYYPLHWQAKRKTSVKGTDTKRTRMDHGEMEDIMFKHGERAWWSVVMDFWPAKIAVIALSSQLFCNYRIGDVCVRLSRTNEFSDGIGIFRQLLSLDPSFSLSSIHGIGLQIGFKQVAGVLKSKRKILYRFIYQYSELKSSINICL